MRGSDGFIRDAYDIISDVYDSLHDVHDFLRGDMRSYVILMIPKVIPMISLVIHLISN